MMDIVERLRERLTRVDAEYGLADEKLDREAIDEIERLRKENKELRKQLKHLDNRLTVLQGTQAAR
jgi:predicted nuclease with TOPRIM domain